MMRTYLGDDADALDGFEFLTMAEAGEVGHWRVVGTMSQRAHVPGLQELVQGGEPIPPRHLPERAGGPVGAGATQHPPFQGTLEGSFELPADEDPNEPA